jgi:hypothetical protein
MKAEDKILELFDEYFETADETEIETDIKYVNSLGTNGVSFEEYIEILNEVTSLSLKETGLCDDILYSKDYNKLISEIQMDDIKAVTILSTEIKVQPENFQRSFNWAGENDYFRELVA